MPQKTPLPINNNNEENNLHSLIITASVINTTIILHVNC